MLAFKMKRPQQNVAFAKALGPHLDTSAWPEGKSLLEQLEAFREGRVRQASQSYSEKGAQECREVFARYNLLAFQASVVTAAVSLGENSVTFQWGDAFDERETTAVADWSFERACVCFNLAASISFLATHTDRTTPDGIKNAAALFQQAAGVLGVVKGMTKEGAWRVSADLSADTVSCLETLMLAQAQKPTPTLTRTPSPTLALTSRPRCPRRRRSASTRRRRARA